MPYASVRAGRNTRIGGGPLFWLIAGPFVAMGYLLVWAYVGACVLGAFLLALARSAVRRKSPVPAAAKRATVRPRRPLADAVPALRDAIPPRRQQLRDPHTRNRAVAAWSLLAALTVLLVAAIVSGARFR